MAVTNSIVAYFRVVALMVTPFAHTLRHYRPEGATFRERVLFSVHRWERQMDTVTQLQLNRRIIQDFTSTALACMESPFSRLAYLASLRDLPSNAYDHAGLATLYPREAVQQALEFCHLEIFERILETPLAVQEEDLRAHLRIFPKGLQGTAAIWRKLESYRSLLPASSPEYLSELFCSNMRAILEILENEPSPVPEAE